MKPFAVLILCSVSLLAGCRSDLQPDRAEQRAKAAVLVAYASFVPDSEPEPQPDPDWHPYTVARQRHEQQGHPLLVILSAEWCPACQKLKSALPEIRRQGILEGIEVTLLDVDTTDPAQKSLIEKVKAGKSRISLPHLALYYKNSAGVPLCVRHEGYSRPADIQRLKEQMQ